MTVDTKIHVEIDTEAAAAYIELAKGQVARTVEIADMVMVDVDQQERVLGIEVLDLAAEIPMDRLERDFNLTADVIETLRLMHPQLTGFTVSVTMGTDSDTVPRVARTLTPA